MKRKYNNILDWVIMIILVIPMLILLALKYVFLVIAKLVKVIRVTIQVTIKALENLKDELYKVLKVED